MAINETAVLAVKIGTTGLKSGAKVAETSLQKIRKHAVKVELALIAIGVAALAMGKSFIKSASTAEQYKIRLNALLGSAKKGNQLFKDMAEYAGRVPFEYREIMGAATQLSGVMRGGVDEIKKWMPMIGDLAAVSGLSIEQTTGQVIRMYSAGAASADMFRERGITAMLGFTAGVKYSVADTRKMLMDAWNDPASKFKGATAELAKSWSGLMSMFSDAWFQFQTAVMDKGPFDAIKKLAQSWLDFVKRITQNQDTLKMLADNFKATFLFMHDLAINVVTGIETGWGHFSTFFKVVIVGINHAWNKSMLWMREKWIDFMDFVTLGMQKIPGLKDMGKKIAAGSFVARVKLMGDQSEFERQGTLKDKVMAITNEWDKQFQIIKDTNIEAKKLGLEYFEIKTAAVEAGTATENSLAAAVSNAKTLTEDLKGAMDDMWKSWQDNFTDVLMNVGKGWQDFIDNMLKDLLRLKIQAEITKPIFDSLGGGFSNIFTNLFGRSAGGGTSSVSNTDSVKIGETMRPTQNKSLASSRNSTSVQIIDKRGEDAAPLKVSKQKNQSGEIIRVVIEEVKGAMNAGEFNGVMLNNFGVMPQGGG